MKKLFSFAIVLAILTSFIGCDKKEGVKEEAIEHNCFNDNLVTSTNLISQDLKVSYMNNYNTNKNLQNVDFENATVVEFSNVEIKGIVADFTDNANKTFVSYYDEVEKEFGINFIMEIVDNNKIRTVFIYNENETPELSFKINTVNNRIVGVNFTNSKTYSEFANCVGSVLSACYEDTGCAVMCTQSFPFCYAAIVAACAAHPITISE